MAGAIIAAVIGGIVAGVGWIWVVITAFRESTSQGLLCLFIPPYAIYYGIKRWSDAKKPLIIAVVGGVVLIVGLVSSCMQLYEELSGVEPVIAEFMEAGEAGDVEAAYACWSPWSVTEEEVDEYIENNYDDLFTGYESLTISGWNLESSGGITEAYVSGAIIYTGDKRLPFEALLVKENNVWKIIGIYIGY
jgi:hypothetical protein